MIAVATLSPNCMGTGCCTLPISLSARLLGMNSLPLMNPAAVSTSCAEDITATIILDITRIRVLWGDGLSVSRVRMFGASERKW